MAPAVDTKKLEYRLLAGRVADVVEIHPRLMITPVPAAPLKATLPQTSQSPAVSEMLVTSAFVLEVSDEVLSATILLTYSPTLPAAALLFVVVPTTPVVVLNVMLGIVKPAPTVFPMLGTPPALVTNIPLLAVANPVTVLADEL
jgi:hypothetical protein